MQLYVYISEGIVYGMSCRNQTLSIPAELRVHPSALGLRTLISSSQTVSFLFISVTFAYNFYLLLLPFFLCVLKWAIFYILNINTKTFWKLRHGPCYSYRKCWGMFVFYLFEKFKFFAKCRSDCLPWQINP